MARKKLSFTTRYVLIFGLLLLLTHTLLSVVILYQSVSTVRSLINSNMLYVVESAAALLDGDVLEGLTEEDVDGEAFRDIEEKLLVFQSHDDIRYIYAVKQVDEDRFVFTVDPDPVDPGAFGEDVVVTDGLRKAGKGLAAVDAETMEDRWGNFYSAFAPVFDSGGKIAGIVGIDFDAAWYRAKIREHNLTVAIMTTLSVLVGGVMVFVIVHNVRKRFRTLDTELTSLSSSVDQLLGSAGGASGHPAQEDGPSSGDEIGKLSRKILFMQQNMAVYKQLQEDHMYRDPVTGITNLAYLRQFADDKVYMIRMHQGMPCIVYFDIRAMVSYNTEYGYDRGNDLLRLCGQTIQSAFPDALVGRGEGDHFIVVDRFDEGIERKVIEINETIQKDDFGRTTGVQCAVVKMEPGLKAVEAVQRARNTLKKIGDDLNVVFRVYSTEEDSEYETSRYVVQHFEEAMENGWIQVYYQPILRTRTGRISSLEALARWVDPDRGIISPGQFIPVLSRYHLLHKLDLYMVEQICREFVRWDQAGIPRIPVSVNFSAQDFDYIHVPQVLNQILDRYSVPRNGIIVEITEQDLAQATEHFREQLLEIHECGYRLWLDDFGSGYSSLNVFSQYHIDRIKFDMELVRHLDDNNGANRIIMETITEMCRQMGIHTLAEGIETEEQYRFLRESDCEMVQGFYFFRPQPVDRVISEIREAGDATKSETPEERRALSRDWIQTGKKKREEGNP